MVVHGDEEDRRVAPGPALVEDGCEHPRVDDADARQLAQPVAPGEAHEGGVALQVHLEVDREQDVVRVVLVLGGVFRRHAQRVRGLPGASASNDEARTALGVQRFVHVDVQVQFGFVRLLHQCGAHLQGLERHRRIHFVVGLESAQLESLGRGEPRT